MGRRVLTYLVLGVATIVGVALLFNLFMTFFVGGRQVTVPDVRGLLEPDAAALLRSEGLRHQVIGEEFTLEYPESTVSGQNPQPGKVVKQGRKIAVMMSKGGEFREVPYCAGKPLRTARIILEKAGLVMGSLSRVTTARGYPEEVLSTEPVSGSKVVRGHPVNILVNDGLPRVRVLLPDLRGQPYLKVRMKLDRLGLFVQESALDERFNPLRSHIVLQRPPAGYVVARGDTVVLVITSRQQEEGSL